MADGKSVLTKQHSVISITNMIEHLLGEGGSWGPLGGVAGRGQDGLRGTLRAHAPPVPAWGQALLGVALPLPLLLALQHAHSAQTTSDEVGSAL